MFSFGLGVGGGVQIFEQLEIEVMPDLVAELEDEEVVTLEAEQEAELEDNEIEVEVC